MVKAARADSICTLFVFLHLLECQTKGIAELLLAHAEHQPAHAHAAAHVPVGEVWQFLGHTRLIP